MHFVRVCVLQKVIGDLPFKTRKKETIEEFVVWGKREK